MDYEGNLRSTNDLDIAINVSDCGAFNHLMSQISMDNRFRESALPYRLSYSNDNLKQNQLLIDILPFGGIEDEDGKIYLAPDGSREMTMLGFNEAIKNSLNVFITDTGKWTLPVINASDFFVLKLIAWYEKYPERKKDAGDMKLIIENYISGYNQDKLFEANGDLLSEDDFDYDNAAARILGRDIKTYSSEKTVNYCLNILRNQIEGKNYNLASDMAEYIFDERNIEKMIQLLETLTQGIKD